MSLHDKIMALPYLEIEIESGIVGKWPIGFLDGHEYGFRDGRHAAAQLAKEADAEIERLHALLARKLGSGWEDFDAACLRVANKKIERMRDDFEAMRELVVNGGAEIARLRTALADVVDVDWAYLGRDADTENPDSLYSRVRRGRLALVATFEISGCEAVRLDRRVRLVGQRKDRR